MASSSTVPAAQAKVILQQCLSGRLQVQPPTEEQEAQYVEVGNGLVVYVCFYKGAESSVVDKMVKTVLNVKLSEGDGKRLSILDLPGDVLIIPQATLGGRLKGKVMQYHNNIDKETGFELYSNFTQKCLEAVSQHSKSAENNCVVKWGTYGNRQVLKLDTNGPYTHQLDF